MTSVDQAPDVRDEASIDRPLSERWHEVVARRGDDVAVTDSEGSLTYVELDRQSATLADRIADAVRRRSGVGAGLSAGSPDPVAILLQHDRWAAVVILACLRAGVPRVNLDPSMPAARLRQIVDGSGARVGVVTPGTEALGAELGLASVIEAASVLEANSVLEAGSGASSVPRPRGAWPSDDLDTVMGITYTSGSTGVPKGVAVRYRTIGREVHRRTSDDWMRESDVVGVVMPLTFGAGQGEVTGTLFVGGRCEFFNPREQGVAAMGAWLEARGITVLAAPPSLLTALVAAAGERVRRSSLRSVRSSGEKMLCTEALRIKRALPAGCRMLNVFGSSEATLISSYEITDDTPDLPRPVPVGRPLAGIEIRLEREDGSEPPPGESGELLVISRVLPLGYWRDEVRTRQRYVPLPDGRTLLRTGDLGALLPNGMYRLAGRKDLSVKIRGNLVEPLEVESALLSIPRVQAAAVVGRPGRNGHDRLIAYVVPEPGPDLRTAALRRKLRERLPSYMIPEAVVYLTELPRTDRGKLDRSALPEPPERSAADLTPPRTAWEKRVAELWSAVLGVDELGLEDDFFDLGGDSLAAEEMVTRIADTYGITVSSRLLVDAPSVAEFASRLDQPLAPTGESLVALRRTGTRPPLFLVSAAGQTALRFLPLARRLSSDQPVYVLQMRLDDGRQIRAWSVRQIARAHVRAIRREVPHGPYVLAGHSFGGTVAFEMAHQLRAAGEQVALLVPLDSFAPHPNAMPPVQRKNPLHLLKAAANVAATSAGKRPEAGVKIGYTRQGRVLAMMYRGRPYAGPTLVVTAADEGNPDSRRRPWTRFLSGRWSAVSVPGTHHGILQEPHVAQLAAVLDSAVRTAAGA